MDPIPPPGPPTTFNPPKKKASGCLGCMIGCLVAVVVLLLLSGGTGFYFYSTYKKKFETYPAEFVSKGFTEEKKPDEITKTPTDKITGKTLLNAPIVIMNGKSDSDVGIIAFSAQVDGIVNGNLYFRGMALEIGPNAVILGDVDVDCIAVVVEGFVKGEIKGKYTALDQERRNKIPPEDLEVPAGVEPNVEKLPPTPPPPVAPAPAPTTPPDSTTAPSTPPAENTPPAEPPANEPSPEPVPPPPEEPPAPTPPEPPPPPGAPTPPNPDPVDPAPSPAPEPTPPAE